VKAFRVGFALMVGVLVPAHAATAATQLGETFSPSPFCDTGFTNLATASPGSSYTVPFDGVITSWSYQADPSPSSVSFRVGRDEGSGHYAFVAGSALQTPAPGNLHTAEIQAPVKAGDVIGIFTTNDECGRAAAGYQTFYRPGEAAVGSSSPVFGPGAFQLDVAASLEADCDADGRGDETQDFDVRACPPGPEATITSGPRDTVRTKRKGKRVTFAFVASETATFECALDDSPFAACTSPFSAKVKRGEHRFEVRAIDVGGNAGPPAVDTWKVKRKRRK
jgi:hypothetical protein